MAQRPPLSLTAELEKLEQSITLTLQEIDHNFSKTHRIVTTSIIPIVERYAKESEAVWEGSKFWKQFFEASANVALSNYQEEEPTYDEPTTTILDGQTYVIHDSSAFPNSSPGNYDDRTRRTDVEGEEGEEETQHTIPGGYGEDQGDSDDDDYLLDDSLLDSLNITGAALQSTPKAKQKSQGDSGQTAQWADIESPFEALKKELTVKDYTAHGFPPQGHQAHDDDDDSEILLPSTPPTNRPRNRRLAPGADPETPESSPLLPPQTTGRKTPGNPHEDALLHRVLDKNWRVQATPLRKAPASKYRTTTATPKSTRRLFTAPDSASPMSSPPKPHLQTQHIFSSPPRQANLNLGPKTPTTTKGKVKYDVDSWDEDEDDSLLGYSPPKTIQFSFPQSKLLATPAREASRRIVKDILMTAGAADESAQSGDSSPPVVSGRGTSRWGHDDDDDDDDMIF